jgi:hypothetical protein
MANPPPNFGGDRQFAEDPETAGISTVVGDLAALNLQLIHALTDVIPDGARALVNEIANRNRQAIAASNASHGREQATRELRPITRVPDAPFGVAVNIANIRLHNVPTFNGTSADTLDVVRWLSRIFILAQSHQLSFDATINLMIQASSGGASDYISQMHDERKTLAQVVQLLEMRYGNLCSAEEATVKCNTMIRKEGEALPEFIDRLRSMARMACRFENDEAAQRRAIDQLVEGNIRRVLPSSVRNALEERIINRQRIGLSSFTAREMERECLDLERRRDERKVNVKDVTKRHIRRARMESPETDSSESSGSSVDDVDPDDLETFNLIQVIKQQEKKYDRRGVNKDPRVIYKRAFQKYNQKYPPQRYPQDQRKERLPAKDALQLGARQAVSKLAGNQGNTRPSGPPDRLGSNPRRTINELLSLANCIRDQCIQCGLDGHFMRTEKCPLRDKQLVDRPCVKCGHGLHQASECPRVFQTHYTTQQQPQVANLIQTQDELLKNDS